MLRIVASAAQATVLLSTVWVVGMANMPTAAAVSVSSIQLQLFAGKSEAFVNTQSVQLDEPPVMVNGQFYVPAKWVADALKMQLHWDPTTQTAQLLTSKSYIQFDPSHDLVQVNGNSIPFSNVTEIRNGRLLVKLSWLAPYTNMTYRFNSDSQSVELSELGEPASAYKESTLHKDDNQQNSRPIAKFAFGKAEYRLGEPVTYTDLSYDPDSEGLPVYDWSGKKDVYFKPGNYNVFLTVKDGKGNQSEPFMQTVKVVDVPYVSEQEYPLYFKPIGSLLSKEMITAIGSGKTSSLETKLPVLVKQSVERPLLRGSSSKPIIEKGFLYQGKINGRARLYTQYVNGMNSPAQLAIVIRNNSESSPVHIGTTVASDSAASIYTPLLGRKLTESFLTNNQEASELVVNPGTAVLYKVSPELSAGQGFQGIYDVKTDGEVDVTYVMLAPGEQPYELGNYRNIVSSDIQRSLFPVSEVSWQVDARILNAPYQLGIGDGSIEPVLKGVKQTFSIPSTVDTNNESNAGVRYRIHLDVSGKTSIVLAPRAGFYEGAIRVNGKLISMPAAGLTANEAMLLYRTSGFERSVDIELMTSGSTQLPIDFILYPLANKQ